MAPPIFFMDESNINHWHYQILRHTDSDGNEWVGLHEVYKDYVGNIVAHTDKPDLVADNVEELMADLKTMLSDAENRPAIDEPKYGDEDDIQQINHSPAW